ncbi:hypothetical protein A2U01_0032994, partial [Trifolium medium]|nr:hypothetical protein [Trifolium medium]
MCGGVPDSATAAADAARSVVRMREDRKLLLLFSYFVSMCSVSVLGC